MSTQHTPGPWFYLKGDEWSHSVVTYHGELPDGSQSCWTVAGINKQREPEHQANAHLIAAAPELLAALLDVQKRIKEADEWWIGVKERGGFDEKMIDAVIAKATGKSK
jgi:hypothetical protein